MSPSCEGKLLATATQDERERPGCTPASYVLLLLLLLTAIGLFPAWMVNQTILAPCESRIPHVCVLGENLGGLTEHQASRHLEDMFARHDLGDLVLSDGHHSWRIPWAEAGMCLDPGATAQRALPAGRAPGRFGGVSLEPLYFVS